MDAEEFAERIIGRRYWFSSGSLSPVCLVAMKSAGSTSWAAYVAGVPVMAAENDAMAVDVANYGAKLDETTARAMFPNVTEAYRA